ncbi:hypothetical protein BJ508DRAFT_303272 [Ascobolus immersus RN42]|uniref:Uncharacterized protein n=1 Tax=Ascobolus immersus RN42 TaxID=1160509 RepID=A0A3N4IFE0_ASCIM|nr:hypothetical protein BJ508DRAFT_303272 [Ascobolus immersus RN42]
MHASSTTGDDEKDMPPNASFPASLNVFIATADYSWDDIGRPCIPQAVAVDGSAVGMDKKFLKRPIESFEPRNASVVTMRSPCLVFEYVYDNLQSSYNPECPSFDSATRSYTDDTQQFFVPSFSIGLCRSITGARVSSYARVAWHLDPVRSNGHGPAPANRFLPTGILFGKE